MSAWVVSKTHIDLLVRAGIKAPERHSDSFQWWRVDENGAYAGWRRLDLSAAGMEDDCPGLPYEYMVACSPSAMGQILVNENVMSVHHRYPDTTPDEGDLPGPCDAYYMGPYIYSDPGYTLTPGEVFQAIDCLDYQSCEHDGWRTSEAFALLASLRDYYCRKVDGYNTSPWGWETSNLPNLPSVA